MCIAGPTRHQDKQPTSHGLARKIHTVTQQQVATHIWLGAAAGNHLAGQYSCSRGGWAAGMPCSAVGATLLAVRPWMPAGALCGGLAVSLQRQGLCPCHPSVICSAAGDTKCEKCLGSVEVFVGIMLPSPLANHTPLFPHVPIPMFPDQPKAAGSLLAGQGNGAAPARGRMCIHSHTPCTPPPA